MVVFMVLDAALSAPSLLASDHTSENAAPLPSSAKEWRKIGGEKRKSSLFFEALLAYKEALQLDPDDAPTHLAFAGLCAHFHDTARALRHYNHAIKLQPDFADAYAEMSALLLTQNNLNMASSVLQMATRLIPDSPRIADANIDILRAMGRKEEALALCLEALRRYPEYDAFFCVLAELTPLSENDPATRAAKKRLDARGNALPNAPATALAIARIYDRAGRTKTAFSYFLRANRWRKERHTCCEQQKLKLFDELRTNFSHSAHPAATASDSVTPVFILGMPRSGTTLLEQMLDCHPLVHGAGELTHLSDLAFGLLPQAVNTSFPDCIPLLDSFVPQKYTECSQNILSALRARHPTASHICDKTPLNFLYIGLIFRLFPHARILHCRRGAMDTCFSLFTHHFNGNHEYAHDLGTLGRYYRAYDALMRHWEAVYPGRIHTVRYEALVEDSAPTLRCALDYLGLEWNEACLRFYENTRPILTSSRDQANRPLYRSSIGHWKAYEGYLQPLTEALGDLAAS